MDLTNTPPKVQLETNMVKYRLLMEQQKEIESQMDFLKLHNLSLMQSMDIQVGGTFNFSNISIQMMQNQKKVGVDIKKLTDLIGAEQVEKLRTVPVEAITEGVKDKSLPKEAADLILTVPGKPFTMIKLLKETPQKPVSLSE